MLPACKPVMSGLFTGADAHPGNYPTVRAVEFMGRYLDERTGGRLGIKMFAGGQLGSETDTLEITSFGGIDFNLDVPTLLHDRVSSIPWELQYLN